MVVGYISYILPYVGTMGDLTFNLNAQSGNRVNQISTANHLIWDTMTSWTKQGSIALNTSFVYLDGFDVNWNSITLMDYEHHQYRVSTKNIDINTGVNLYCYGYGGYGGNFMNW